MRCGKRRIRGRLLTEHMKECECASTESEARVRRHVRFDRKQTKHDECLSTYPLDPRVLEDLVSVEAKRPVSDEQMRNKIFCVVRNIAPLLFRERVLSAFDTANENKQSRRVCRSAALGFASRARKHLRYLANNMSWHAWHASPLSQPQSSPHSPTNGGRPLSMM